LVIGSDGLFEYLKNSEIVEAVLPFFEENDAQGACDRLVCMANERWQEQGDSVDDISAIVIFVQY
jgi:serine/threonine protein phosphatase PrpC